MVNRFLIIISLICTSTLIAAPAWAFAPKVTPHVHKIKETARGDANYNDYLALLQADPGTYDSNPVSTWLDYGFRDIRGRILGLEDGADHQNPFNVLFTVNGKIYYIPFALSNLDNVISFHQVSDISSPGSKGKTDFTYVIIVRGFRTNRQTDILDRVIATIRVADKKGKPFSVISYTERVRPSNGP